MLALVVSLIACGPRPPVVSPTDGVETAAPAGASGGAGAVEPVAGALSGIALGGGGVGHVLGSTRNGGLVVVRRWPAGVVPEFAHHGEPRPEPEIVVLDFAAGTERVVGDLIDVDERRDHLLVEAGGV